MTLAYELDNETAGDELSVVLRGDHDSVSNTVEIVEPPDNRVELETETSSYESGSSETPTIAGTVTNEGGANATESYDLVLDVANGSIVTDKPDRAGLNAGESTTFAFDLEEGSLSELDPGSHPIVVTESFTGNDASGSLSITTNESETNETDDSETETDTDDGGESGSESTSSSGSSSGGGSGVGSTPTETTSAPIRGYVGDGTVTLEEPILTAGRGDVVPITLDAGSVAEGGALLIGNESTADYRATIHVETFGEAESITVLFNTYTAGTTAGPVVELDASSREAGASIAFDPETDQTVRSGGIGAGEYPIVASTAPHPKTAATHPTDVGALVIEQRETTAITTWTTARSTANAIREASDPGALMTAATRNGTVTRSDEIAHGDVAVLELEATGLSGMLLLAGRDRGTTNATERFRTVTDPEWSGSVSRADSRGADPAPAVDLDIAETSNSVSTRSDRRTIDIGSDGISVATGGDRDRVYLLVDTARLAFEDGTTIDPSDSATFRLDVQISDELTSSDETERFSGTGPPVEGLGTFRGDDRFERPSGPIGSGASVAPVIDDEATTTFSVVERDVGFREDPYHAPAATGQVFEGTTSIAPGTPLTVDIQPVSERKATFEAIEETVIVSPDGSWSATVDLSSGSVGDRYRVHVKRTQITDDRPSVHGTIVGVDPETTAAPSLDDRGESGSASASDTTPNSGSDSAGPLSVGTGAIPDGIDPETLLSVLILVLFVIGLYRGRSR
ncbi:BGTF surface domain-containing protein [Halopenitus sp. H-Gu1]|uniref:BGTF surface domain-containing protein n=1 Tax=Halopenitus sp. H-Gu1 TaxID=3242697 RepID=UPI00359D27D9